MKDKVVGGIVGAIIAILVIGYLNLYTRIKGVENFLNNAIRQQQVQQQGVVK